jgi:hypothetical protein
MNNKENKDTHKQNKQIVLKLELDPLGYTDYNTV